MNRRRKPRDYGLGMEFYASEAFGEVYWQAFKDRGPRHRNVARWLLVLGWSIREGAMQEYLAPELKGMH